MSQNTDTADIAEETQAIESVAMKRPEFAARWQISLRQLDLLIEAGICPRIKLGRRLVRIPVEKADAALMSYCTGGNV